MAVNKWSFEYWMCEEVHNWMRSTRDSLDLIQLKHSKTARNAIARLEHLVEHPRPLDLVRDLHPKILAEVEGLRTLNQARTYAAVVHSELLCTFPLRIANWPGMKISQGRIPNNPASELLHIGPEHDPDRPVNVGRYSIVVPVRCLKNGERNHDLRKLDPPRVVFQLPSRLDQLLSSYLTEVRPRLIRPQDEGKNAFFLRSADALAESIEDLQSRWMIRELDLHRPWGPHAYRALVATHVVKNALANPYRIAAALLLDKEETVRKEYSRFRPEDDQLRAHAAIALQDEFGIQ